MVVLAKQVQAELPFQKLDLFAIRIAVINSMLNPMACAALCKPYRRGILYYFRKMFSYIGFSQPDSDVFGKFHFQYIFFKSQAYALGVGHL